MKILDLESAGEVAADQAAQILFDGFQTIWSKYYPDLEAARREVVRSLAQDRISRVALDDAGQVLGWIGGVPEYDGQVYVIYPLVVREDVRDQGLGRELVADLERLVRERGALTIYLGTDDTAGMTSIGGVDLYPNVLEKLAEIKNLDRHPFGFYLRLGFEIVGVVPDANGLGKPDILMAKRVAVSPA
jgi:aminoglycoside 6'-N-acetyltransferase I